MKKSAFFCTVVLVSVCACSGSEPGSSGPGAGGTSAGGSLTTGGAGGGLTSAGAMSQAGSSSNTGGAMAGGGATPSGGSNSTGGSSATGGNSAVGGTVSTGGSEPVGGTTSAGGANITGGAKTTGGATAGGGTSATGGTKAVGGTASAGGAAATGGATSAGGTSATGGAGATGGSNTAGASTSGAVTPVQKSNSEYDFNIGTNIVFAVNPQVGGRVITMSLGGTNVIVGSGSSTTNYGSTFWTSPQSAWDGNTSTTGDWPPPTPIDSDPYTATISGNHLVLTGSSYSTLGVNITKDFSADATTGWVTLQCTINASKALQAAPWEITRVPRGGIAFFLFTSGAALNAGPLTVTQTSGAVWWDDTSQSATSPSGAKLIADGSGGWLAYARGGILFLKKFPDIAASAFAPGEGDTEIYPGSGYNELEVQGAYTSIAANGKLVWTTNWRVATIPGTVTVAAGSTTLLDFAKQQAAL